MTDRVSTVVQVDAGVVYAEGMRNGLRTAINLFARSGGEVPPVLRAELTAWTARVFHREWLADQGRPVEFVQSEQAMSFIHLALQRIGLESFDVRG